MKKIGRKIDGQMGNEMSWMKMDEDKILDDDRNKKTLRFLYSGKWGRGCKDKWINRQER